MSLQLSATTDTFTFSCGSPCGGEGLPTCEDYEKNRELEWAALQDPAALAQLRDRYRRTTSREELARIGGFLVSVLDNDNEYFLPLAESTETLLTDRVRQRLSS